MILRFSDPSTHTPPTRENMGNTMEEQLDGNFQHHGRQELVISRRSEILSVLCSTDTSQRKYVQFPFG